MKRYLELFITMLKVGLFTFGGGYAMLALLENEFVSQKGWLEKEEFLDMVAISESTPGPIAINSATWIGYRLLGFWGSLTATVAICIPSFVIIYIISLFLDGFLKLTLVANAFRGIQVCVVYLIFSAGWKLLKSVPKKPMSIAILAVTLGAMVATTLLSVKFSAIFYILASGFVGLVCYAFRRKEGKDAS